MMRRSFFMLAAKAAATHNSLAGVPEGGLSTTEEAASQPSNFFGKVEVATGSVTDASPSAAERPELLQSYVEPKPFVSARRLQLFTASMVLGITSMAVIYFLMTKSISENLEAQQMQLDTIAAKNKQAIEERDKLFKEFSAPSSLDDIKMKMSLYEKEMERNEVALHQSTSALHTEVLYRLKSWWNSCLTNIQDAADRFAKSIDSRNEAGVEYNIRALLENRGYEVVKLEKL
ncbi:hypothetical protein AGDE_03179 [Angomonas deanei]|uniref:Transmembrane protein n=1 Tax=Angomonas deanei TaxID=59799 RepID=A0A7G2C9W7_9TRYP|nr:hypothetical protein AGDE_03179 [Angomonas deanei]CAD2216568.1 hypothetical protein, conserved [Angomonas deanei]|eukprot:EPY40748.1 hypothetical protein AGDE_03179 [Angomonas deanei]